jgi:histidyl-tRNA synthetase
VGGFGVQLNSRRVLAGLLEAFGVPADLGPRVLITLDKLDKLAAAEVIAELAGRGLTESAAAELVEVVAAPDAAGRIRDVLKRTEQGMAGLDEVNGILDLAGPLLPPERVGFSPRLVRGLSYYTGPIWEVTAEGMPGSLAGGGRYDHLIEQLGGPDVPATGGSLGIERILLILPGSAAARRGRLDVAVTVIAEDLAPRSFGLAAAARSAGLRASVYLGSSGKLGRQLKWASDQGASWALICGPAEAQAGTVTVRDMVSGQQTAVPANELGSYLARAAAAEGA